MALDRADALSRAEELWKWDRVAAFLGVSKSWVYQHAESGDLPSVRFAGNLRFVPEEIRAYVAGKTQRPALAAVLTLRPGGGS